MGKRRKTKLELLIELYRMKKYKDGVLRAEKNSTDTSSIRRSRKNGKDI